MSHPLLLMTEPRTAPLPPEADLEIPDGEARTLPVKRGQLLTIVDRDGGRTAGLFAFVEGAQTREFLSPHHTRVFSNSYVLALGMRLVTNRRRPIMVLGRDRVRRHDLLLPASDTASLGAGRQGTQEAVQAAVGAAGLRPVRWPDPVTLFLDLAVRQDGSLVPQGLPSRAGDLVAFRILLDSLVVVSACATGLFAGEAAGPIQVQLRNRP